MAFSHAMLREKLAAVLARSAVVVRGVPATADGQPTAAWRRILAAEPQSGPLRSREKCPVLIVGHNRSGTTFAREVMRAIGIPVTNEFHVTGARLASLGAVFDVIATTIEPRAWLRVSSIRERIEAVFVSICEAVSEPEIAGSALRGARFANKTPDMEHHTDFYETVFGRQALYIYCLRHGRDVIVSSLNTRKGSAGREVGSSGFGFDDADVQQALKLWKASVHRIESFMDSAPGRVLVFQLDRMNTIGERLAGIESIYRFLGLEPDSTVVQDIASRWEKKNDRPNLVYRDLSTRQQAMLDADTEFQDTLRRHGYARTTQSA